ncbi:MAG TPA: ATP-dependent 6-phosphofructokinase [Acidimicrobiia bacterium]|nr:ATP-dependent 6-phosphofructokinase [Acidimicrobiia bacterium]
MSVGVLTAGGDCPGLNAAIRAVVTRLVVAGVDVVGVEKGWQGLMEGRTRPLHRDDVRGIIARGGTILGTSRVDPYVHGDGYSSVAPTIEAAGIETMIVLGGDGSLRTAARLHEESGRVGVVGIPKTIDNDIPGTDVSLGFHTAVQIVVDAIDRLTTTAESHDRIMVVEVMGRMAGWIATSSGIAGGAEAIVVPEVPTDYVELARHIARRHEGGHDYSLVIVAEGAPGPSGDISTVGLDAFGFERLGGVGARVARELESLTGYEARVTTLGYLQRGGIPTAFDRLLGTRFGINGAELALDGATGVMVALRGNNITTVGLDELASGDRKLDLELLEDAAWFFA